MRDSNVPEALPMTRRAALAGTLAGALVCSLPWQTATVAAARSRAAVYAYPGMEPGTTKLAVTWPRGRGVFDGAETRIHVDHETWWLGSGETHTGLVMPSERFAGGRKIWAERLGRSGARQRIGSPLLAAVLDENPALAELYHTLSPEQDVEILSEPVATTHGRRLAAELLPDVLYYDSRLPAGFTFAARNGRHPRDAHSAVVSAILAGSDI